MSVTNSQEAELSNRTISPDGQTGDVIDNDEQPTIDLLDIMRRQPIEAWAREVNPFFRHPADLNLFPLGRRLADQEDGKIVIFGLQKAGNTWLLALLGDVFELSSFFNLHDPAQVGQRGVISTHDPVSETILRRRDFVHGVCLIRDLRDMVASYFHYMQTESFQADVPQAKYPTIETFYYDWFLSRMVLAHRYYSYAEEYAALGIPVLRYEDLVRDTKAELKRLFLRWPEKFNEARMDAAIQKYSFATLKATGLTIGTTSISRSHFRRGDIGSYKDELPKKIIRDIETRFGPVLTRWGYE